MLESRFRLIDDAGLGASPPSEMKELPTMKARSSSTQSMSLTLSRSRDRTPGIRRILSKARLPQKLELAVDEPTQGESQKPQSGTRASPTDSVGAVGSGQKGGLTSDEARLRLERFGPNAMPDTSVHPLRLALEKF
jgi:hypothetical protein